MEAPLSSPHQPKEQLRNQLRQKLQAIRGVIPASRLVEESHRFSLVPGGVPRGALTEIAGPAGHGKTSLVLRLLAENPGSRAAWIEPEKTLYPPAFALHGVSLERILFIDTRDEGPWAARQLIRSGLFDFVILATGQGVAGAELRRLQLASEQQRGSTLLLSEAPHSEGAWAIRLRLEVVAGKEAPLLRSRVGRGPVPSNVGNGNLGNERTRRENTHPEFTQTREPRERRA